MDDAISHNRVLETKVVILGDTGVGKTSMVNQYVRGQFTERTQATIGAAFMRKDVLVNDWNIILQIWDTAGQERFRSMALMYYRGAHAAILVFDITSRDTLEKVGGWVEELQEHANEDIVLVLAANKCDLRRSEGEQNVTSKDAQEYAKSIGATVFETSAKTGKGIEDLFNHVARHLLTVEMGKLKGRRDTRGTSNERTVQLNANGPDGAQSDRKSGCCS